MLALILHLAGCRSLLYYPTPAHPFDPERAMKLEVEGAQLRIATRRREGGPAILYFGGNAEDVTLTLEDLARLFPDHALYLMHYRGYGGSTGSPTEAALQADALALYDTVRKQHPRISVLGRSLGSGIAIRLASERPVERLALITPYDSMASVAKGHYPYLPTGLLLQDKYESLKIAPQIKAPTTLIVADHDEIIPRRHSDALLAAFTPGVATEHVVPGTDHNDIGGHPLYGRLLRDAAQVGP